MAMQFDEIDKLYFPPNFEVKLSTTIKVMVKINNKLDGYHIRNLPNLISNWTYPKGGKNFKPFSLIEFNPAENGFVAEIRLIKKDNEIDELKLFCQDILDIFNCEKISVLEWEMEEL
ncbi:hypothetical protein [Paenibacillus sp. Soil787]|uniref:hypothetical protein n=1 Tax=Paenibacillus sp. Soil787 TaxID=1736411 RepID=UPI0012E3D32F|nr:hypothetical protein [Paenibacillus sp. Soil787]